MSGSPTRYEFTGKRSIGGAIGRTESAVSQPDLRPPARPGWGIRAGPGLVETHQNRAITPADSEKDSNIMKLARTSTLALAAVAFATLTYAAKNPMVGGKEMFPNKNIIENAV